MKRAGLGRVTLVIAVCALVGAIAGIAGSAAAPSKSKSKTATAQKKAAKAKARAKKQALAPGFRGRHGRRGPGGPGGPGFARGPGGRPVHSEAVVPNADGTGFDTVTMDGGTLNSVDGTTVHLKEGTDKKVYKDDVALDVGSDAKVYRNHAEAKLSDLKADDHVRVLQSPQGNVVVAEDDAFIAQKKKDRHGFGRHRFGPGGPPPGAPGPPAGAPDPPASGSGGSNENGSTTSGSGDTSNS